MTPSDDKERKVESISLIPLGQSFSTQYPRSTLKIAVVLIEWWMTVYDIFDDFCPRLHRGHLSKMNELNLGKFDRWLR